MVQQIEIILKPKRRGFHLVTSEIMSQLPKLPKTGVVNIFTKHTSCGLSINENCDPDVRVDMETIFNRLVPENRPEYEHTLEGADDMPAHAKSTLSGVSITIPITNGRLNLGTCVEISQNLLKSQILFANTVIIWELCVSLPKDLRIIVKRFDN